ncbi:Holliday junction resolvase RuvX [Thermogutta sp.]|uniref:Holliday junction resolvase RuvX n=1 Tax=Thermogutta sp. TaxID=1962930 RepID=UPI003220803F
MMNNEAANEQREEESLKRRPLPERGRIAGLDYGKTRIGIALSDPGWVLATPWSVYRRRGAVQDAAYFQKLVQQEQVVLFVLGLPVHCDGTESEVSLEVREFGKWLESVTRVPVVYMDERFSTQTAETWLRTANFSRKERQKRVDKLAAQIILSSYLAILKRGDAPPSWSPSPLDDPSLDNE